MIEIAPRETEQAANFGLKRDALSPLETLAQSISTIAPSTSPTLTVPLVFGLAGNGTWLAYAIALAVMLLVALCVRVFARDSASPGSLYTYTRDTLPAVFGAVSALAMFFAYVMIAASCVGGFVNYAFVLLGTHGGRVPAIVPAVLVCGCALAMAYWDVAVSARVMLWIEAVSVLMIGVVTVLTLWHGGWHVDMAQARLAHTGASQVRLGVVLAMFSFVGFESATTLGAEARDPLRSIPRAVLLSALLSGAFFMVCSYAEVLGFHGSPQALGESTAPFRYLATQAGVGPLGVAIDCGVLVAMFAAVLGCVLAAARVALGMAHSGLAPRGLGKVDARHGSPVRASVLAGVAVLLCAGAPLLRGVSGADVYGYMGTLAVFGFLTAYSLLGVTMLVYLRRRGRLTAGAVLLAAGAVLAMAAAFAGTVWPAPPMPYRVFPYVYAGYLVVGLGWFMLRRGKVEAARA